MEKKTMKGRMFLSLFLVLVMVGSCIAAGMPEFSADMITTSKGVVSKSKVYFAADKNRIESEGSTTITRQDKKVIWVLMPSEKAYFETPLEKGKTTQIQGKIQGEVSRVKMGKETVNKVSCTKYKVAYKNKEKTFTSYQWISDDGIPVKTSSIDGSWSTEYKNIKIGKIDAKRFEIPKGYTKMSF